MRTTEYDKIRFMVVTRSTVSRPYNGLWSVSITFGGHDLNQLGETIERAYVYLTNAIYDNAHYKRAILKHYNNANT